MVRHVGRRRGLLHRDGQRDGRRRTSGPTLFLVDGDTPGIETIDDPPFAHSYPHGHPTLRFDCVVRRTPCSGGSRWSVAATRDRTRGSSRSGCTSRRAVVGAMRRLLVDTVAWASSAGSSASGSRLPGHLVPAGRLGHRSAAARCSRRRLRAGRRRTPTRSSSTRGPRWPSCTRPRPPGAAPTAPCRPFGGRGYVRTNVAERFLRELRVDRIWEGTSEIQRLSSRARWSAAASSASSTDRWTPPASCARGRSSSAEAASGRRRRR